MPKINSGFPSSLRTMVLQMGGDRITSFGSLAATNSHVFAPRVTAMVAERRYRYRGYE